MARAIRKWLTPDSFLEAEICRPLVVPHYSLLPYIAGALAPLTDPFNWEQFGDLTPDEAAEIFTRVLESWEETCMDCQDLINCLGSNQANVRYNPETGAMERSFDGGETWEDATNSDPRHVGPRTSIEGDCFNADSIVRMVQEIIDQTTNEIAAGAALFSVVGVIIALVTTVLSAGAALPLAIGMASTLVGFTAPVVQAALTNAVYEQFRCIVYCAVLDAETITVEMYEAIRDGINAEISDIAARSALWQAVTQLGSVGLQNAAAMNMAPLGISANDCDDCDCDNVWCYTFDFTANNQGFTVVSGSGGVYDAGLYWRAQGLAQVIGLRIEKTIPTDTVITGFDIVWGAKDLVFNGDAGLVSFLDNGGITYSSPLVVGSCGDVAVWTTRTVDGLSIAADQIRIGTDAVYGGQGCGATNGFVQIQRLTLRGTGDNPFGLDNCP